MFFFHYYCMFVLNAKLCNISINFGGIWRFELGFLYLGFSGVLLKKYALIFKSPMATLRLGMIHRKLFSFKNSEGRSATIL